MPKSDVSRKRQELCLQCLECCKVLGVPSIYNPEYTQMLEFYKRRGCEIVTSEGQKSFPIIVIPFPCPELTPFGCRVYNERPLWCALYDGRRDPAIRDKCLWSKDQI